MALQIAYNTGDTNQTLASTTTWLGQTFLTVGGFDIQSVKVYISKNSGTLANLTASIRAVSGVPQSSIPTGADLVSGTVSIASLGATNTWIEVTFSSPLTLLPATRYAIVIRTNSGFINWRRDASAPNYADGNAAVSSNSGSTWSGSLGSTSDFLFETYSAPVVVPIAGTILGESTLTGDLGFLVLLPMQGSFIVVSSVSGGLSFPYDFWPVPRNATYSPSEGSSGGERYRNSIIVIGVDSNGLGVIYRA